MNPDPFENRLQRQRLRPVPPAWREEILTAARAAAAETARGEKPQGAVHGRLSLGSFTDRIYGLLWPCPQAWAGLAAVWLVILGINLASTGQSKGMAKNAPRLAPERVLVMKAPERLFSELKAPVEPSPVLPAKPTDGRPRSQRREELFRA